ncbi:hypothetical protein E4U56_001401 [Claviceps arundinis]|uniref:Uncharacterized protein n=1 Tax=Claviceps arundinis TaxID=1623583 RepID=A0A9P7SS96_9HYPO|nr:hypothetical protein E4U56_001401 [Claviceps arundinis]
MTIETLKSRGDMVKKAFLDVGISIKPDGSEDHLIFIKNTENQNDIIQPEPSHDEDDDFIQGPVPDDWSFTDQHLAAENIAYEDLPSLKNYTKDPLSPS